MNSALPSPLHPICTLIVILNISTSPFLLLLGLYNDLQNCKQIQEQIQLPYFIITVLPAGTVYIYSKI
jgi:hypothetical protein